MAPSVPSVSSTAVEAAPVEKPGVERAQRPVEAVGEPGEVQPARVPRRRGERRVRRRAGRDGGSDVLEDRLARVGEVRQEDGGAAPLKYACSDVWSCDQLNRSRSLTSIQRVELLGGPNAGRGAR